MRLVSKPLENLANFRSWREAQSSIRIQEGPPSCFALTRFAGFASWLIAKQDALQSLGEGGSGTTTGQIALPE